MPISLNELKDIEQHLFGTHHAQESLLFQAKQVLDPSLNEKIFWQKRTCQIVQQYGRKQLRGELAEVEQQLFHSPVYRSFRYRVLKYFRS